MTHTYTRAHTHLVSVQKSSEEGNRHAATTKTLVLPVIASRCSGDQHVASTHCGGIAVADALHMIHECPVLQPLRLQYAALFTPDNNTMR